MTRGYAERVEILAELQDKGYQVVDLSDDEMAKLHVRYMVGGRPSKPLVSACSALNSRVTRRFAEIPAYVGHSLEYFSVPLPQPWHRFWPGIGGI